MAAKAKPTPPPPPKLPTREEVAAASAQHQAQQDDSEERDEDSTIEAIRSDLQDAHEALTSAWSKLDDLEAEQS